MKFYYLDFNNWNLKFGFQVQKTTFAPNTAPSCKNCHFSRKIDETFYVQTCTFGDCHVTYFQFNLIKIVLFSQPQIKSL